MSDGSEKRPLTKMLWSIWNNVFDSYCFNSCKEFQWKFIHNVVFTEHRLFLMGYSNGICNLCSCYIEILQTCFSIAVKYNTYGKFALKQ